MLSSLFVVSFCSNSRSKDKSSAIMAMIFCSNSFCAWISSLFCAFSFSSSPVALVALLSKSEICCFKFAISAPMVFSFCSPPTISPARSSSFLFSCWLIASAERSEFFELFIFSCVLAAKAKFNDAKTRNKRILIRRFS